jgi:undecaprenyl-diphosphatase
MTSLDQHLFALLHAPLHAAGWHLALALGVVQYGVYVLFATHAMVWIQGRPAVRQDLVLALIAVALGCGFGLLLQHVWPRPPALDIGNSPLARTASTGFPSRRVLAIWTFALALLSSRPLSSFSMPLLAAGLMVGWAQVYLGTHYPLDVAGTLPIAGSAAILTVAMRTWIELRIAVPVERRYEQLRRRFFPSERETQLGRPP